MENVFLIVCIVLGVSATAWVWWYENGPQKKNNRIEQKDDQDGMGEK